MEEKKTPSSRKPELVRQTLIADVDRVIQTLRNSEEHMVAFEKVFNETQWYLGEERTKRERLETELKARTQSVVDLEAQVNELKQHAGQTQWYLGEEKARREELEKALQGSLERCRSLEIQLDELRVQFEATRKELQDTQWYLGEERTKNAPK
ncbi:MAG: hypothetical protein WCG78_07350 [Candidatus Omnitrophota bacterium]